MSRKSTHSTTPVDYKQLAGLNMSTSSKHTRTSASSKRSKKGLDQLKQVDHELNDTDNELKDDPTAHKLKIHEQAKQQGVAEPHLEERPIPKDLSSEDVYTEAVKTHTEEERRLNRDKKELDRRREFVECKQKLVEKHREIEQNLWEQEMAEREIMLKAQEAELLRRKGEQDLDDRSAKICEGLDKLVVDTRKSEHSMPLRTEEWVKNTAKEVYDWETRSTPGAGYKHGHEMASFREQNLMTSSQIKINKLQAEVRKYKQELQQRGENREVKRQEQASGGIRRLKDMGIMPQHLPDDQMRPPRQHGPPEPAELKKLIEATAGEYRGMSLQGKHENEHICVSCSENTKMKSGKYVKSNISIKRQEQWPHLNTLKKYCKRVQFDQMEFDAFIAGETRIIYNMQDGVSAMG